MIAKLMYLLQLIGEPQLCDQQSLHKSLP